MLPLIERLTDHQFDDDFPFLLQRRDGTYLLVWTRLDREKGSFLSNKTSETFYATSKYGIQWNRPVSVTNDTDIQFLDILPTAYETKDDCYIVWVTWHRATPNDADAVEVPLSGSPCRVRKKESDHQEDSVDSGGKFGPRLPVGRHFGPRPLAAA